MTQRVRKCVKINVRLMFYSYVRIYSSIIKKDSNIQAPAFEYLNTTQYPYYRLTSINKFC